LDSPSGSPRNQVLQIPVYHYPERDTVNGDEGHLMPVAKLGENGMTRTSATLPESESRSLLRKQDLSPSRRRFLESIQYLNNGRIEGLKVRDGEPIIHPPPRMVRKLKLKRGANNGPRAKTCSADSALKKQVRELFDQFDRVGTGVFLWIEVQDGLPLTAELEDSHWSS